MAGSHTLTFDDATFEEDVLQSEVPVLVDFWAEWCAPCKALGPVIDDLATEYAGRVKVGKVNTDTNQGTASRYGISAIPTVILFQNGEIKEKFVGLRTKNDFKAALNQVVPAGR